MIRCAPLTPGSPAHTRWPALLRSQACFPATYSLMISWERFCASSVRPAVLLNQCTAARSNLMQEAGLSRAYSFTHWLAERDVFAHWSVHTSISCMRWARPEVHGALWSIASGSVSQFQILQQYYIILYYIILYYIILYYIILYYIILYYIILYYIKRCFMHIVV